jgi:hypothetical protein
MKHQPPPRKSRFFQLIWGNDPEQDGGVDGEPPGQLAFLTCLSIRFVHPPLILTQDEMQDLRWLLNQSSQNEKV